MAEEITPEKKTEEVPQAVQAPAAEDRKWYVIQTLTGNEELVKASIERTIKQFSLENKVFSVLVPEEDIVEIKEGKRVEKKKKMFPGYVFVEMILARDKANPRCCKIHWEQDASNTCHGQGDAACIEAAGRKGRENRRIF
jgi:hypothetical protein